MTRRVLVTGASGFIGRQCLPVLAATGYEVHAVSSRIRRSELSGVLWHQADLFDSRQSAELVDRVRPSHLLHLAWYVEPRRFWKSSENLRWVGASLDLLRLFANAGGRHALISGTCVEYALGCGVCSETTPTGPSTLYGSSKHALHIVARSFASEAGFRLAWARLFYLFGPHEPPARLVPSAIGGLLRGEHVSCNSGELVRDFLYVSDVAEALLALLNSDADGTFNIGSGAGVALGDIVRQIGAIIGRPELVEVKPSSGAPGVPAVRVSDTTRIRTEVGWAPRHDLAGGLERTIEWWRAHPRASDPACAHA